MNAPSDEQRLARMRSAWRAATPDAQVVAKAYQRFAKQRTEHRSRHWSFELLLAAAVAGGVIAVLGGVFTGTSQRGQETAAVSAPSSGAAASAQHVSSADPAPPRGAEVALRADPVAPAGLWIERAGTLLAAAPGVQYRVAAGERVAVIVDGERHVVVGPKLFELMLEVDRASGFRVYQTDLPPSHEGTEQNGASGKHASPQGNAPRQNAAQSVSGPAATALDTAEGSGPESRQESAASSGWVRAAAAMRNGDIGAAESELRALSRSASAETRDAAELTLAQVWLTQDSGSRARPVLLRLSQEGATARIRRRAAELLNGTTSSGAFPPP